MSDSWKGMVKAKHPITQIYNNNNLKNKKKIKKPTNRPQQSNNAIICTHVIKNITWRVRIINKKQSFLEWSVIGHYLYQSASQIHFTRFIRLIKVFSIVMRIKCNF